MTRLVPDRVSCLIWRGEMADLKLKYAHLRDRDSPA
jgi:hypothetical protein